MKLARFHLTFGILLFVAFLVTGQFMIRDFPDKTLMEQDFRVLMRSRHIYILLISLSHILLGTYLTVRVGRLLRAFQYLGSSLLTAGAALMLFAFFLETYTVKGVTIHSRFGLFASLGGAVFHLIGGIRLKSSDED